MKLVTCKLSSVFLMFIILSITFSCNSKSPDGELLFYDCDYQYDASKMDGKIDDTEKSLMEYCSRNNFTSKEEIESNLIGSWILNGYGNGWRYSVTQPCAHIWITKDALVYTYEDGLVDTVTTHTWRIQENEHKGKISHSIKAEPRHQGLKMNCFSDDYMFFNHTPLDGNMYLYRRIK